MSFLRHGEIYRSDESNSGRGRNAAVRRSAPGPGQKARRARASLIVHDRFPVGYSSAGCSPARLRFTNRAQYALGQFRWQSNASQW